MSLIYSVKYSLKQQIYFKFSIPCTPNESIRAPLSSSDCWISPLYLVKANSSDLSLVYYKIIKIIQQQIRQSWLYNINELKPYGMTLTIASSTVH